MLRAPASGSLSATWRSQDAPAPPGFCSSFSHKWGEGLYGYFRYYARAWDKREYIYIYILESSGRALRRGLDSFLSSARQRILAWRLCKCKGRYACGFTIAAASRLQLTTEACGASGGSGLQDQDRGGDSRVSCLERKTPSMLPMSGIRRSL